LVWGRWTAGARLEAVITTAAMNEASMSAWCREHGVYPTELAKWRSSCTTALADPEDARASRQATRAGWSGNTRDWSHVGAVTLNPERDSVVNAAAAPQHPQPKAA
jgi:hypothetical protein